MITVTLGWGAAAALLAWTALAFWLGRASARPGRSDLSGLPADMALPRPAAARPPAPAPVELPPDQLAAIRAELARGNKIAAIKLMREATGVGLAEAKHAVEAMQGH